MANLLGFSKQFDILKLKDLLLDLGVLCTAAIVRDEMSISVVPHLLNCYFPMSNNFIREVLYATQLN